VEPTEAFRRMTKQDEQLLMQQLSDPAKQRKAFEQVVSEYGEQLYWQIRRMVLVHEDADDVLQNVFIKAWSHLDDFHQDSRLSTWLYRIAVNECLDFLRKQKNSSMIHTDDVESGVANMLVADNYFDGDETEAMLQEAINQLPDVQRTVFTLRYYDDMKYSEMSRILKTSEGSLKASYHIAVKKISEFFKHRD
jgi:RNA polymerase sigma-70 factor (ECF subfamily)